jgi:hypothetical protein
MSMQFSFGKRFLRTVILLGFLGCLMAQGTLQGDAVAGESLTARTEVSADSCGLTPNLCPSLNDSVSLVAPRLEIGVAIEFSVAFEDEDSVEMFRFDVHQRTFEADRTVVAAKLAPKLARKTRLSISPPLLV